MNLHHPVVLQRRERVAFRSCPVCKGSCVEITESRRLPMNQAGVQGTVECIGERPNPNFNWPLDPDATLFLLRRSCTCCGGKGTRPADPDPAQVAQLHQATRARLAVIS